MCILHCFYHHAILCFCTATPTPDIYTLSLHDALPISRPPIAEPPPKSAIAELVAKPTIAERAARRDATIGLQRSEEHTSELQSRGHLVCRLLLEKKKLNNIVHSINKKKESHTHKFIQP